MNTKLPLILAAFGSFWILPLHAQTTLTGDHVVEGELQVGKFNDRKSFTVYGETGGTAKPGIRVIGGGGLLIEGGTGPFPVEGDGTRFMWYAGKRAFAAGSRDWFEWTDSGTGTYSFSFGEEALTQGHHSVAFGLWSSAGGYASLAFGEDVGAAGGHSIAFGYWAVAYDQHSVAIGDWAEAYGKHSIALGGMAMEDYSFALWGTADAEYSIALGEGGTALGEYSTSVGRTTASSYNSVAVGRFNVLGGSTSAWEEADPLFVIGNGMSGSQRSNALTVLKNGRTTLENKFWDDQDPLAVPTATGSTDGDALVVNGHARFAGRVVIEPQGDLSMGSFTSSP